MPERVSGKVSVLIPCYNEGPSIRANLREICAFLKEFAPDYEVICIDDGSCDGTWTELEAAARSDPRIRVLHYEKNHGKGFALQQIKRERTLARKPVA